MLTEKYTMVAGKLYKIGKTSSMKRLLYEDYVALVLEEVHERVYRSHISWRAIAQNLLRADFYWPTLMKDNTIFMRKRICQRHSNLYHPLTEIIHYVTSPWLFYQQGMNIYGPFHLVLS